MTVDADPFAASMSILKWLKSISVTSSRKFRYSRCPSLKLIISACWFGSYKLSIFFSIDISTSSSNFDPFSWINFMPLYSAGLCEAEIIIPRS